jgi:uncharacterized membrane protein YkvA (DUF1232 family)
MKISPKAIYNWYGKGLRNPKYRWWIILGSLIYLLSPLDISPDLVPIAGQLDDIILLTLMLTEVSQVAIDYAKTRSLKKPPAEEEVKTIDVDAVSVD